MQFQVEQLGGPDLLTEPIISGHRERGRQAAFLSAVSSLRTFQQRVRRRVLPSHQHKCLFTLRCMEPDTAPSGTPKQGLQFLSSGNHLLSTFSSITSSGSTDDFRHRKPEETQSAALAQPQRAGLLLGCRSTLSPVNHGSGEAQLSWCLNSLLGSTEVAARYFNRSVT